MTVSSIGKSRKIADAIAKGDDAKGAIMAAIGDVSGIELLHNLVLVATYIRPATTQGGIILPDSTLVEDRFQGKVGLVLGLGPIAFESDVIANFPIKPEVGDWVLIRPTDGWELFSVDKTTGRDGTSCRLFEDSQIRARLADPTVVY